MATWTCRRTTPTCRARSWTTTGTTPCCATRWLPPWTSCRPASADRGSGGRAPPRGRVLAHASVDGLAEEVGMPGVAAVLLEQVADQSPEAGVLALCRGCVDQLVESAVGERRAVARTRALHRAVPEPVELLRAVVGRRPELPVVGAVVSGARPRLADGLTAQLGGGV